MPEYFIGLALSAVCPDNEIGLVTAYINPGRMSPHHSTNALHRQIRHPELSLQKSWL